jgi:hypothetical protein
VRDTPDVLMCFLPVWQVVQVAGQIEQVAMTHGLWMFAAVTTPIQAAAVGWQAH